MNVKYELSREFGGFFYSRGTIHFYPDTSHEIIRLFVKLNLIPNKEEFEINFNISANDPDMSCLAVAEYVSESGEDDSDYVLLFNDNIYKFTFCNYGLSRAFGEIPNKIYLWVDKEVATSN